MITRRRLLLALGIAPLAAFAQTKNKVLRIGFLAIRPVPPSRDADRMYLAFRDGMRELGYVEGQNVIIDWRTSGGRYDVLPSLAADLVQAKVEVLVATSPPCIQAAKQATSTIPIVMVGVGDVVALGFAKSWARPGGNLTGVSNVTTDLPFKQVELLRVALPRLARLGALVNPSHPDYPNIGKNLRSASEKAQLALTLLPARAPSEIEQAFAAGSQANADAVIVQPEASFILHSQHIAELAIKHRLPSMYAFREHVTAGGLMSYGVDSAEQHRRAASYVDKILKGAKPAELPIEQPLKFELVINLRTAKALGLTIPQELLLRADEVIE